MAAHKRTPKLFYGVRLAKPMRIFTDVWVISVRLYLNKVGPISCTRYFPLLAGWKNYARLENPDTNSPGDTARPFFDILVPGDN